MLVELSCMSQQQFSVLKLLFQKQNTRLVEVFFFFFFYLLDTLFKIYYSNTDFRKSSYQFSSCKQLLNGTTVNIFKNVEPSLNRQHPIPNDFSFSVQTFFFLSLAHLFSFFLFFFLSFFLFFLSQFLFLLHAATLSSSSLYLFIFFCKYPS